MIGKTRTQQWVDEQMLNPLSSATPTPPSFADAMKAISAFANSPDAVKKELAKLAARIEAAEKAEAAAKAAIAEQELHKGRSLNEIDAKAAARAAEADRRDAASLARDASRTKTLEAREAAVRQRELEAERLTANAKAAHDAARAQIDAFDRAATVRVS
jgi:hypothetical protein